MGRGMGKTIADELRRLRTWCTDGQGDERGVWLHRTTLLAVLDDSDTLRTSLAASQAECARMREALKTIVDEYNNGPPYSSFDWIAWKQRAERVLSTPSPDLGPALTPDSSRYAKALSAVVAAAKEHRAAREDIGTRPGQFSRLEKARDALDVAIDEFRAAGGDK